MQALAEGRAITTASCCCRWLPAHAVPGTAGRGEAGGFSPDKNQIYISFTFPLSINTEAHELFIVCESHTHVNLCRMLFITEVPIIPSLYSA